MSQWKGPQQQQSDQQYMSGTAKMKSGFELKFTPAGKEIATAKVEFNDSDERFGELVIWEPSAWFSTENWWSRFTPGVVVGFRGTVKDRSWEYKGKQYTNREVNCYKIGSLLEKPARG